ncbi:endonuclease/exonuclease/phosphatase family protein [Jannaschia sp. Os4]|uniref:endonuclease/exonuclease/phosphatase family protein n=1 Tax=Jannaschia sp. Os4 TaxID=2807617 RepID=UPI00193A5CA1|nr:endonuclease/exonuclease/phosphatase family protein [Jannaschia sp. Os4]MBM2574751.1 endonuclease/exonuclease/phosphatase family protein [Jannaschia sp. Os4]
MSFRFLTWNVEWFNTLFDDHSRPAPSDDWSARWNVTKARQIEAIGTVLRALDPDAALIVEAPDESRRRSTVTALEALAERLELRVRRTAIGFGNDTKQELALMHDPARVTPAHAPGEHDRAPRFDGTWKAEGASVVWSKPPLELDLHLQGWAETLHLIGVHAKSKAAGGDDPDAALRRAVRNRRKHLAQCAWLRGRVDGRLAEGRSMIVAGDFNDGPGLDRFEALFGRSGLEMVVGEGEGALHDPAAIPPALGVATPQTARFWHAEQEHYIGALLDFALVSGDLKDRARWRIVHPLDDPAAAADDELQAALLDASDHFPVVLDLAPEVSSDP